MENWFSPELIALIKELEQPGAYVALALILAACPLAWAIVRLLRGPVPQPGSVWFGGHVGNGVLFPGLWLGLAAIAYSACLHWHLPLAVFHLAIPILMSLAGIRLVVRVMRAAFPSSDVVRLFEKTVSWMAWLAVVLWITGVLPSFLDALDEVRWKTHTGGTLSLRTVLEGTVLAGFVLVITLSISSAIEAKLLRGALGPQLSLRKAFANVLRAGLVFIGLLLALDAVGIDLTALSVLGGAIGVGLGFGLQKVAANYVSGFVILTERALRIGDTVKVDGFEGQITDIATRYTVLRALNGRESIVPNELLITSRVESATLADTRLLLTTVVQVGYETDLDALMPRILEAVAPIARVLPAPGPSVNLSNFASDGLELTVAFWIADPENGTGGVRSDVNLALLKLFNQLGVEIPYPQRVVRTFAVAPGPEAAGVVPGDGVGQATQAALGPSSNVNAAAPAP